MTSYRRRQPTLENGSEHTEDPRGGVERWASASTLFGLALAFAASAQGAHFVRGFAVFTGLCTISVATELRNRRIRRSEARRLAMIALPFAGVWLLQWLEYGWSTGLLRFAGLLFLGAAGFTMGASRRAGPPSHIDVLWWIRALGVVVACSVLAGTLLQLAPLAAVHNGLWRAGGLLTYPNVAATITGVGALVGLGYLDRSNSRWSRAAVLIQLTALVATFSRGGLLAVGACLTFVALRNARLRTQMLAMLPAGLLAGTGALLAAAGSDVERLVGGALIVLGTIQLGARTVRKRGPLLVGMAVGLIVVLARLGARGFASRFDLGSDTRWELWSGTARAFADEPLTGVGVGRLDLSQTGALYTHNEYLQWLAETGVLGAAMALASVLAIVMLIRRSSRDSTVRLVAVAATIVVASQAAFDLTLHVPLVVVILGTLLGVIASETTDLPRNARRLGDSRAVAPPPCPGRGSNPHAPLGDSGV